MIHRLAAKFYGVENLADLTEEQAKKADLGVGKLFLAPVGKLEEQKMSKHY